MHVKRIDSVKQRKICRIGQIERCSSTGCEWHKAFGYDCSDKQRVDNEVKKHRKIETADQSSKKQKKPQTKKQKSEVGLRKSDNSFIERIGEAKQEKWIENIGLKKQEDWIKKIKYTL